MSRPSNATTGVQTVEFPRTEGRYCTGARQSVSFQDTHHRQIVSGRILHNPVEEGMV